VQHLLSLPDITSTFEADSAWQVRAFVKKHWEGLFWHHAEKPNIRRKIIASRAFFFASSLTGFCRIRAMFLSVTLLIEISKYDDSNVDNIG